MEALILAGGRTEGLPVPCKADLPLGEGTMLDVVVQAFREAGSIRKVTVVRDAGDSMLANLLRGVEGLGLPSQAHVLVSSCDIPFLTGEAVDDFLHRCTGEADVYYPIIRREDCEGIFPGARRTYARLREGTFTGGNLFLVRVGSLPLLAERLERLIQRRKSPLRLAAELGFGLTAEFLLSMWLGTLSIPRLERKAARLTGIRTQAVLTPFAEIGTDIDKRDDLGLLVTNTN